MLTHLSENVTSFLRKQRPNFSKCSNHPRLRALLRNTELIIDCTIITTIYETSLMCNESLPFCLILQQFKNIWVINWSWGACLTSRCSPSINNVKPLLWRTAKEVLKETKKYCSQQSKRYLRPETSIIKNIN